MEKLLVLSNFFIYHYVFKKPSAAEASESIYMRERVKELAYSESIDKDQSPFLYNMSFIHFSLSKKVCLFSYDASYSLSDMLFYRGGNLFSSLKLWIQFQNNLKGVFFLWFPFQIVQRFIFFIELLLLLH